jgi:RNA polymerase sigma factor (sigma-70 family)
MTDSTQPPSQNWVPLLERLYQGDPEARASLALEFRELAYRVALSQLKNSDAAEDAAQDTVLRVISHLGVFSNESTFRAYVCKVAQNRVKDDFRNKKRKPETPLDPQTEDGKPIEPPGHESPIIDSLIVQQEKDIQRRKLAGCLALLSDQERQIVLARLAGFTNPQMVVLFALAYGAIAATLNRGTQKLKDCISADRASA